MESRTKTKGSSYSPFALGRKELNRGLGIIMPSWVFHLDPPLTHVAFKLYVCLCYFTNGGTGEFHGKCGPSYKEIRNACGISSNVTIRRAIAELEGRNLITTTARMYEDGGRASNLYTVHAFPPSVETAKGRCQ